MARQRDNPERYVDHALGHPTHPMSMPRLQEKLENCFRYVSLPNARDRSARLVDAVAMLENIKDVRELGALVR